MAVQKDDRTHPGSRIRAVRLERRMTQAALAEAAGISAPYLNLIEHGRRRVGGALLARIAEALGRRADEFAGTAAAKLARDAEAAARASGGPLGKDQAAAFVAAAPGWAGVVSVQGARIADLERAVAALSDRLAHDPALDARVHDVLSTVTSVRSAAAILRDPDLPGEWWHRFLRNLSEDSRRLSDATSGLAAHLNDTRGRSAELDGPSERLAAWLASRSFHLPQVENGQMPDLGDLGTGPALSLGRAWVRRAIDDAAALPLADLKAALSRVGRDPLSVAWETGRPVASVIRRMASMPAEDLGGQAGFVECDGSGAILMRRPIEGFEVPRHGGGCPLWPLYQALLMPQKPVSSAMVQPGGGRAVQGWAAAEVGAEGAPGGPLKARSVMLLLPAAVTGGGDPVTLGPACRICPVEGCGARQEPTLIPPNQPAQPIRPADQRRTSEPLTPGGPAA